MIFIHNHPSGEPGPSEEDKNLTETLTRITNSLGIMVLDHIIVGRGKVFNMKANAYISSEEDK